MRKRVYYGIPSPQTIREAGDVGRTVPEGVSFHQFRFGPDTPHHTRCHAHAVEPHALPQKLGSFSWTHVLRTSGRPYKTNAV